MVDLVAKLCQTWGPSGSEDDIRALITNEIGDTADEITTDALGNLIARKGNADGYRIMLSAHMDEIGLVVTNIDEKGFLRFSTVGGISPYTLLGQRVRFASGLVGSIGCEPVKDIKNVSLDKQYIDIGATSKEDAMQYVQIGDMCCYHRELDKVGNRLIAKALDNRIGCAILIEVLRRLGPTDNNVFFVFSTQEEVGLRGARTSAYSINPQLGIAVDVTSTGDTPEAKPLPVELGKGAAIKVKDASVICHPAIRRLLVETARQNNIPHQMEVLPAGGTDAGAIQAVRTGVAVGGVSIPTRYIHSPAEMVDLTDVQACIDLLTCLVEKKVNL